MKKVLSVIIPVYNMEKYIRQCLESLMIKEVLDKIEILLISAINPLHRHNRESTLCMPAELLAINPCKQSTACLIV